MVMCRVSAVCSISLLLLHDANSNTAVIKRCFFMDRFFYDKGRKTKGKSQMAKEGASQSKGYRESFAVEGRVS